VVAPTSVNGGISSGIAVAPGPLADDHVDPEVLHGEVEHLLGGTDIRWISSTKRTSSSLSPERMAARSPAWVSAGPLVTRRGRRPRRR
jgi:hypothetical protein